MDLARLRVCTARCFLDGFAQIREMQGHVSLPIFAAMSPIDKVLAAESMHCCVHHFGCLHVKF